MALDEFDFNCLKLEAIVNPIGFAKYNIKDEFPEITDEELAEIARIQQLPNFEIDVDLDWVVDDPFEFRLSDYPFVLEQLEVLHPVMYYLKVDNVETWLNNGVFYSDLPNRIVELDEPDRSRLMRLFTMVVLSKEQK